MAGVAYFIRFQRLDELGDVDTYSRLWRAYALGMNKNRTKGLKDRHYLAPLFWPPFCIGQASTKRVAYVLRVSDLRRLSVDFLEQFLQCFGTQMVKMVIGTPTQPDFLHMNLPTFQAGPNLEQPTARDPDSSYYKDNSDFKKIPMVFAVYVTSEFVQKDNIRPWLHKIVHMNLAGTNHRNFTRGTAWLGLMDAYHSKTVEMPTLRTSQDGVDDFKYLHKKHSIGQCVAHFRQAINHTGPGLLPSTFAVGHFAILSTDTTLHGEKAECTIVRVLGNTHTTMQCQMEALLQNLIPLEMGMLNFDTCRLVDPEHMVARSGALEVEKARPANCKCPGCEGTMMPETYDLEPLRTQAVKTLAANMDTAGVPPESDPYLNWWLPVDQSTASK